MMETNCATCTIDTAGQHEATCAAAPEPVGCARHCFHAAERPDCRISAPRGKNCDLRCCKCDEWHWG